MDILIFTLSMIALLYGAEFIINESEKIALKFNISSYVIGATLVAFGTSLPEMAISISASFKNSADIAVSNVIGSTIFNIALVLGLIFIISKKIKPKRDLFEKDAAWAIFPILIFIIMSIDGTLNFFDGILFIFIMVAFILFLIKSNSMDEINEEILNYEFTLSKSIFLLIIGFSFTIIGANYAVNSASNIALSFGVSEWIIGLFLLAFGTSLPELIISVKAALKNNADMAIGNIIGSNVANFTMVLGLSSIVNDLNVDLNKNFFDISVALILCLMLVFIMANKLYNKSSGVVFFVVFLLVVQNSYLKLF